MTRNERIQHIYKEARKVGITHQGAIGLLGNLQGESSQFDPMSLEGAYADRYNLTDAEYTRRANAGEITRADKNKTFINDSFGYGIAQWTYSSRKENLLNFAKSQGVSVGDLDLQIQFMFREMQTRYTKTWKTLTTTNDYRKAVKICVVEFEKPEKPYEDIEKRTKYAAEFLKTIPDTIPDTDKTEEEKAEAGESGMFFASEEAAIAALIAWFTKELGYIEKRSNSQLQDKTANAGSGNYTKYAADIDENYPNFYNGKKNGFPWCDVYIDDGFINVFGYNNAIKMLCSKEKSSGAGCIYSADYYRAKGRFFKTPKVGDQIFFGSTGNETHTGFVTAVTASTVTTNEGNTSDELGVVPNGGMVCQKQYNRNSYYIVGYGRPDYSIVVNAAAATKPEADKPTEKPVEVAKPITPTETEKKDVVDVKLNTLKQGDKGAQVKAMQMLIIGSGYSCGSSGADGDFGSGTLYGLKLYQKAKRLTVDGICGVNTWTKLLKG